MHLEESEPKKDVLGAFSDCDKNMMALMFATVSMSTLRGAMKHWEI
jgi:hypothetical protein